MANSLCDHWESAGIDGNGDGSSDFPIQGAPYNANPNHKDLFLEIDYMVGAGGETHRPDPVALQAIVKAFAMRRSPTQMASPALRCTCWWIVQG
jgi:hypothetical protein